MQVNVGSKLWFCFGQTYAKIGLASPAFFFWNGNRQMVSLRWLKFGGTPLHWPKPSDKCDI
jgi:hypothetical protein